jgi:hypothetical protein
MSRASFLVHPHTAYQISVRSAGRNWVFPVSLIVH